MRMKNVLYLDFYNIFNMKKADWTIILFYEWQLDLNYGSKSDVSYLVKRRKEKAWIDVARAFWIPWECIEIETRPIIDKYEEEYYKNMQEQEDRMKISDLQKKWYSITKL